MLVVRAARPEEWGEVADLVFSAHAEFADRLAPDAASLMRANLAKVVDGAGEGNLLVTEGAGPLVGTVTHIPPGHRDYDRIPLARAGIRALAVSPAARSGVRFWIYALDLGPAS